MIEADHLQRQALVVILAARGFRQSRREVFVRSARSRATRKSGITFGP